MTEQEALFGIVAIVLILCFIGFVAYVDWCAEKYGAWRERKRIEGIIKTKMQASKDAGNGQVYFHYQVLLNELIDKESK